ncbi:MAG: MarR family winged helix-turn-helix transcriptional regulator [Geminicoccaceae bacterium]
MFDIYVDVNVNTFLVRDDLPLAATHEVRDRCLCLHLQRAARVVARLFDDALRPFGLTNGQFSLLMAINRPKPPRISDLVPLLAMDRTTLTAALKPLQRRGLVQIVADSEDRRNRRLQLTDDGIDVVRDALPVWRSTHDELDQLLPDGDPDRLRETLSALAHER